MDMIFREISTMSSSFAVVNQAIEDQAAGGVQILTTLKIVQEMTVQVQEGTMMIHQRSNSIHKEMEKLHLISQEVISIVYEMRLAGGNIASFLEKARELATDELVSKTR